MQLAEQDQAGVVLPVDARQRGRIGRRDQRRIRFAAGLGKDHRGTARGGGGGQAGQLRRIDGAAIGLLHQQQHRRLDPRAGHAQLADQPSHRGRREIHVQYQAGGGALVLELLHQRTGAAQRLGIAGVAAQVLAAGHPRHHLRQRGGERLIALLVAGVGHRHGDRIRRAAGLRMQARQRRQPQQQEHDPQAVQAHGHGDLPGENTGEVCPIPPAASIHAARWRPGAAGFRGASC